ncbi:MAG: GTP cyclohydrolase-2 [Wolbachia endosymbiont of Ctenocephalides orientis wCori]|nr:MAG: GTP cyclohydrolase-2 [Wolbachia endosymbiont of Ctenocephalides orientis wCori]
MDKKKNKVERAISEIRRGQPIMLYDEQNYLLFSAVETLDKFLFDKYKRISGNALPSTSIFDDGDDVLEKDEVVLEKGNVMIEELRALDKHKKMALLSKVDRISELLDKLIKKHGMYVTLTANKVRYMLNNEEEGSKRLLINNFDELLNLINCTEKGEGKELQPSKPIDDYAVVLLKLSELLPYGLVVDMLFKNKRKMQNWCEENDVMLLNTSVLSDFERNQNVYEVCRTSLFLKQTQEANIISYRAYSDGKEHYAIIIGNPDTDKEPLVRIHSSCYTGDLLDSLACDCRSQLHKAIQLMNEAGGGIILYLIQDGRGIGLTNKLRAYDMQKKCSLDTVDANRIFGFEDDERSFTVAAEMLKKLNIKKIKLLTNNGRKLSELENNGIEVTKRLPLIVESNKYNDSYMKTKLAKLGHKLRIF